MIPSCILAQFEEKHGVQIYLSENVTVVYVSAVPIKAGLIINFLSGYGVTKPIAWRLLPQEQITTGSTSRIFT